MSDEQTLKSPIEAEGDRLIPSHKNSRGLRLDPTLILEASHRRVDFRVLEGLTDCSIVRASQFDKQTVVELCKFAALLEVTEIASHHPLDGKLVVTAFFEASTRTRLSFESAVLRLDGKIVSVPDGKVTGIAKGESLADIGEMFNTYGDLVVVRHPENESVEWLSSSLNLPIINAGNGYDQHPTQALVDWYTLVKWRPHLMDEECAEVDKLHIGLVGTPGVMRVVNSFIELAIAFGGHIRKLTIVSEEKGTVDDIEAPFPVEYTSDLDSCVSDFDVLYMNSIALVDGRYKELSARYKVNKDTKFKPGAVVMHPFARRDELDTSLDETQHNLYFAEAAGAVFVRQALLISVLNRIPRLPPSLLLLTT